jgi:hypothetical protein
MSGEASAMVKIMREAEDHKKSSLGLSTHRLCCASATCNTSHPVSVNFIRASRRDEKMYLTRSEYDRGVNTFSPEGR